MLIHSNKKQWLPNSLLPIILIELGYYIYLFEQQVELFWHPINHGGCLLNWTETETGWNFIILYLLIITSVLTWRSEAKKLAWIVKYGSLLSLFLINLGSGFRFLPPILMLFYMRQPQVLKAFDVSPTNLKKYIKYAVMLFALIFFGQLSFYFSDFVDYRESYYTPFPYTFSIEENNFQNHYLQQKMRCLSTSH
jgi:hypothetical protein